MNHSEFELQKQVCRYISLAYPKTLYLSDTIASCKLTIPQANRNRQIQKAGFKCPDLIILQPNKSYAGLLIELKTEAPFKKDGTIKKSDHLEGQYRTIADLNDKGYRACFSWGFDMTKKIIDDYLNEQEN